MNIPDEYFTDEAPTEPGLYAVKRPDGSWFTYDQSDHRPARNSSLGFRFCCLAPAAEVERLKAENEKLRGWVRDAYEEGRDHQSAALAGDDATFENSMAKVRLERRSE